MGKTQPILNSKSKKLTTKLCAKL